MSFIQAISLMVSALSLYFFVNWDESLEIEWFTGLSLLLGLPWKSESKVCSLPMPFFILAEACLITAAGAGIVCLKEGASVLLVQAFFLVVGYIYRRVIYDWLEDIGLTPTV